MKTKAPENTKKVETPQASQPENSSSPVEQNVKKLTRTESGRMLQILLPDERPDWARKNDPRMLTESSED